MKVHAKFILFYTSVGVVETALWYLSKHHKLKHITTPRHKLTQLATRLGTVVD